MSQRETKLDIELQQWRGVDQRTSPTLVQDGFFVMSRGVFFGLGDNAERIPGKHLVLRANQAVFNLVQFGSQALVQTLGELRMISVNELMTGVAPAPPAGDFRITEDGNIRITEDGNNRVVE